MAQEPAERFATCLSCMDGRVILPVTQYIRDTCQVQFVDIITEAGMDGFLAHGGPLDGLLRKIDISFQRHGSSAAFIVGHAKCSGNAVSDEQHRGDILKAIDRLRTFRSLTAVGGLWVTADWRVQPVGTLPPMVLPTAAPPVRVVSPASERIVPSVPMPIVTTPRAPAAGFINLTKPPPHTGMVLCRKCGSWNERDSNFCDQCAVAMQ